MPKRKPPADPVEAAHSVLEEIMRRDERRNATKNSAAVALGRLGGLKGGPARAAALTPERRSEIAKKAAAAREAKRKKKH
ncbi:MAG TPA: hypothetical protein VM779_16435 [Thermoanaerobaculia bacterium]|nr:hypothetical protein [Thermoanaerobaculia bacterium]